MEISSYQRHNCYITVVVDDNNPNREMYITDYYDDTNIIESLQSLFRIGGWSTVGSQLINSDF